MSTMLEQALVDAAQLKEAALKNAETAILERYATDVKNTMNSILEQEEEMGLEPEEDPEDQIPDAATEGEKLCPCPDDEEVKTFTFSMNDMRDALENLGGEEPMEDSEDLAIDMGAEEEPGEEEEELALQEELELDEELLFEYPVEEGAKPDFLDLEKMAIKRSLEVLKMPKKIRLTKRQSQKVLISKNWLRKLSSISPEMN
jgi:hypothetical protein